jgi:hypothetical protein
MPLIIKIDLYLKNGDMNTPPLEFLNHIPHAVYSLANDQLHPPDQLEHFLFKVLEYF